MWRIRTCLSHLWRSRSNFSHVWQICADFSHVWQIRSNVKVKRICHKNEKFERSCDTCKAFVRFFHSCDKYVRILHFCVGSHEFFTSVIRTHDKCDKFIKRNICNTFIFTTAYLPKHNTVLWKEKCWGDIRLFLRRLGRMWVSRLNRNLFCLSVKHEQSGNARQPFIHFPINVSLIWS